MTEPTNFADNFAGWQGILWYDDYDPSTRMLKPIAARAAADFELLAARSRVACLVDASADPETIYDAAWRHGYLGLCLELKCTEPRGRREVTAVHARLAFTALVRDAVETGADKGAVGSHPRSGKLELWAQSVIGSGPDPQLVAPFCDHVEIEIRKALALFVKHTKLPAG